MCSLDPNPFCLYSFLYISFSTSERPKSRDGEAIVYRLKDWPSGEEFMALMPSRYITAAMLKCLLFWVFVFFPGEC